MAERCERTELLVTDCAHCRNLPDPPTERGERGPWFAARFLGRCSNCDVYYAPGDDIRADGHGGYLADCCGTDTDG